jgi:hypothetical protein
MSEYQTLNSTYKSSSQPIESSKQSGIFSGIGEIGVKSLIGTAADTAKATTAATGRTFTKISTKTLTKTLTKPGAKIATKTTTEAINVANKIAVKAGASASTRAGITSSIVGFVKKYPKITLTAAVVGAATTSYLIKDNKKFTATITDITGIAGIIEGKFTAKVTYSDTTKISTLDTIILSNTTCGINGKYSVIKSVSDNEIHITTSVKVTTGCTGQVTLHTTMESQLLQGVEIGVSTTSDAVSTIFPNISDNVKYVIIIVAVILFIIVIISLFRK